MQISRYFPPEPAETERESIGLIGIGQLGTAIAEHLLKTGFDVIGYARRESSRAKLSRLGGWTVLSAAAVAEEARRIILCLPDAQVVESVVGGPNGLLASATIPRIIIDTSTTNPDHSAALAERLKRRGVGHLDAPVYGDRQAVRERQGVFLVGGDRADYDACLDLFQALGNRHVHLGPSGAGSRAHAATCLIHSLTRAVLAETVVFAERLGIDSDAFLTLLKSLPSASAADVTERILRGDAHLQCSVTQRRKDLRTVLEYAERLGLELPLTRVHTELLEQAIAAGDGNLDASAMIKQIRRLGTRADA